MKIYNDHTDYDAVSVFTISVDFDGVIHDATGGWKQGECYGKPKQGSLETINRLIEKGFEIVVFTARDNHQPVIEWLEKHDFPKLKVSNIKQPSRAYIDDRAIRFTSWEDVGKYFI